LAQIRKGISLKSPLQNADNRRQVPRRRRPDDVPPLPPTPIEVQEPLGDRAEADVAHIETVQGIGDIFWAYQKLAPHFRRINFDVLVTDRHNPIQLRARDFLPLLPKVGTVRFKVVSGERYAHVTASKHAIDEVLKHHRDGIRPVAYAVNRFLEEGTRIDEIDHHPVLEDAGLRHDAPTEAGGYIALYVSGFARARNNTTWPIANWLRFVRRFYAQYRLDLPLKIVGAGYDMASIRDLMADLQRRENGRRMAVTRHVDQAPGRVLGILKGARCFLSYNSGLGILADNIDVPQVMVYFKELDRMHYAWCKRAHIGTTFQVGSFSETPEQILERVDMSACF
jgi:hypothetical protein